jgi:putative component of toxin-antitoxin plasmid stabilization module
MSYQIKELLLDDGDSPFAEWFESLEAVAAAKVRVAVSRMEQGNLSSVEWFRGIGEYKIDLGAGLTRLSRQGRSENHHPDRWRHQEASTAGH